ncbi:MAG: hypothetical protein M1829_003064 [Trizodia sp. TS-e1964]|nr:MAG: hypothetical protein M1829_003064 [Trizodia sp. TS-e1964]
MYLGGATLALAHYLIFTIPPYSFAAPTNPDPTGRPPIELARLTHSVPGKLNLSPTTRPSFQKSAVIGVRMLKRTPPSEYPGFLPWPQNVILDRDTSQRWKLGPLYPSITAPTSMPYSHRRHRLGMLYRVLTEAAGEVDSPNTVLHGQALILRFYELDFEGWTTPKGGETWFFNQARVAPQDGGMLHPSTQLGWTYFSRGPTVVTDATADAAGPSGEGRVVAWSGIGTLRSELTESYQAVLDSVQLPADTASSLNIAARQAGMKAWVDAAIVALKRKSLLVEVTPFEEVPNVYTTWS